MEIEPQQHDYHAQAYKRIGWVMYRRHEIERAVKEARLGHKHGHSGGASSGHAFVSDPTAAEAIDAATPLSSVKLEDGVIVRRPEDWLRVIHQVYKSRPATEAGVMRYYYDGHSSLETALKCAMDKSTVYRIRSEFLHRACEIACQLNLVSVLPD